MQWQKTHVKVLFRCWLDLNVVCECETTVAHHIHLESVTLCLVSDALLIAMSPLKY